MFSIFMHLLVLVVVVVCWFLAKREPFKTWFTNKWAAVKEWFAETFAAVKTRLFEKTK
jgi:predicted ABC-type sugar transport system permease subunit